MHTRDTHVILSVCVCVCVCVCVFNMDGWMESFTVEILSFTLHH